MTRQEQRAIDRVPSCVDLDQLDGGFAHVVHRVEHVVDLVLEGEDFYTRRDARACISWLAKHAPMSPYATACE